MHPGASASIRWTAVVGLVATALLAAGCGGSDDESESGGSSAALPDQIDVTWIGDLTGVGAFVGKADQEGIELAVDELNSGDTLGGAKINLTVKDSGSDQATAATLTSQAASSDAVAVLSPALGNETLAAAPIAQRGKVPFIAMQSLAPGVTEAGDYVFRATTPTAEYNAIVAKEMKARGVATAAMIYISDNPTIADAGKTVFPAHFEAEGIEMVASEGTPASTTDFAAIISKVLAKEPDAVGTALLGAQYATVFRGLRENGFEGEIFALDGATPDILKTAGDAAEGVVWATDYSPALTYPSSEAFTKAFEDRYKRPSAKFSAEAYDATMLLGKALATAKSTDREAVRDALEQVTTEGFEASVGPLKFENRDARARGALVEWDGTAEKLVAEGPPVG
jgi:branched-chain amino acid transport system substrate-binding protein